MNRLVSIAAAAALTALTAAGAAQADIIGASGTSTIQSLSPGQFDVIRLDSLDHDRATSIMDMGKNDTAAVQSAIRSNPKLAEALKAQNVEVANVVAADRAANGSVTFYLR